MHVDQHRGSRRNAPSGEGRDELVHELQCWVIRPLKASACTKDAAAGAKICLSQTYSTAYIALRPAELTKLEVAIPELSLRR